jgi:hypothetical protein
MINQFIRVDGEKNSNNLKKLLTNKIIFNSNLKNIEFYSDKEAFSIDNSILSTILIYKRVKIFKQKSLVLIKSKYGKGKFKK